MISSINNDKVKYWTKLNDKKYQEASGLFLVEGLHLVEEAKKAGLLEEVILLDKIDYDFENKTFVSENVMKKITSLTNIPSIIGVSKMLKPREISGNVLLLDKISNPGNLGTIIRSAVAFNIDTIVLGEGSVSLYNPKVIRATEGLLFQVNIIEDNLTTVINSLKRRNYTIFSTDVEGGKVLGTFNFPEHIALVMGNEGSGVSKEVKSLCDEALYIKMNSLCESLNVGVATSIILYEINR